MELLSSVHWVMSHDPVAQQFPEAAVDAVHRWNLRKRRTLKTEHLIGAWRHLVNKGWVAAEATA